MRIGSIAEAMEPNANHKAVDGNDDDNANTEVPSDSFRVEWTIEVFQNVTSMKEHDVDIEVSTIVGTETKITWVRLNPNASDEPRLGSSLGEIIGWWHCTLSRTR